MTKIGVANYCMLVFTWEVTYYTLFICILLHSCTPVEFSGEESCSPYSLSLNHMTFKYTSDKNISMLLDLLSSVKILIRNSVTPGCTLPTGILICNIAFIPCNLTTGTPRPLCPESCFKFYTVCNQEFNIISDIAGIMNFPFIQGCENTFRHINEGYGYPNTSSDFEDDCYDLPGMLVMRLHNIKNLRQLSRIWLLKYNLQKIRL